jgi:hypothetical protein
VFLIVKPVDPMKTHKQLHILTFGPRAATESHALNRQALFPWGSESW